MKRDHQTNKPAVTANSTEVWLNKQAVLQRMFISGSTLARWRKDNILPYSKIGRKIYYRESDLQEMLKKRKTKMRRSTKTKTRMVKRK